MAARGRPSGGPQRGTGQAAGLLLALRPHHWIKNLLVFLPLLAAQRWGDAAALSGALAALAAFCMTSSAIYLVNDLHDLEDDRRHPHKRRRPLAAGRIGPGLARRTAAVLACLGLGLALARPGAAGPALAAVLALYAGLAIAYSRRAKTIRYLDLAFLGGFYGLRVVAGSVAAGIALSGWLLAFSLLLFLSLAAAKRAAELVQAQSAGIGGIGRRGYRAEDLAAVTRLGRVAAAGAVAVLAAYAQTGAAAELYARPGLLWAVAGLLALWLVHIWRNVGAGRLTGDPILHALRDPASWGMAGALAAALVAAG